MSALTGLAVLLLASLPKQRGEVALPGLRAEVKIAQDALGVPAVQASTRGDALRALGWLHARDRLFQMELMRRKSAGRLAELFGAKALELDKSQRVLGLERAARAIVAALPTSQRQALADYAAGVNAYLAQAQVLPPEFLLLRHRPEEWRAEDSLLVGIGMFQTLNGLGDDERMLSVMEKALPVDLVRFLTPDSDPYDAVLAGGPRSRRPPQPIPVADLAGLEWAARTENAVDSLGPVAGSNNWVVGGARTRDGRAIVADDMHLNLSVPNIWYRASLGYEARELTGVTLPGLPLVIVGSNRHVAWGFTNVEADVVDLARLEINPANPREYRTPQGWKSFEKSVEKIVVKGGGTESLEIDNTIWGPVSPKHLLGQPVAIHWTALQPDGVDFGLLDMDGAATLEQAMDLMNRFAGPTQNVVLADERGRIAWTLLGRFPKRRGFDGSVSRSWADGGVGWAGYIAPEALPRVVDPPSGYIATANNRTLGSEYPYVIAHNQANGYRVHRISQRLAELEKADERDLFAIQLDSRSEFFDFYRDLALEVLSGQDVKSPELEDARRYIEAWDGNMDAGSQGIGLLWRFRENLAATVFAPMVKRCRQFDGDFTYSWRKMETPLRALLTERPPAALPQAQGDWKGLILSVLVDSIAELKRLHGVPTLQGLDWGRVNRLPIRHPFSKSMPFLSSFLDMEDVALSGCAGFCVRIVGNGHGASERMVISPGHPEDGILHMPAGQSGHPLSPHYRDQHPAWREGTALPLGEGKVESVLTLRPERPSGH